MRALEHKLVRELWRLKGQMLSIALVVATGIMTVVTMRGGHDTLVEAQRTYYQEARFAHIWASLKRAPEALRRKIEDIPGVATVETRVTFLATLDLDGLDAPGSGQFVSLPSHGRPLLNDIRLTGGRLLAPAAAAPGGCVEAHRPNDCAWWVTRAAWERDMTIWSHRDGRSSYSIAR